MQAACTLRKASGTPSLQAMHDAASAPVIMHGGATMLRRAENPSLTVRDLIDRRHDIRTALLCKLIFFDDAIDNTTGKLMLQRTL
jgi:hypothetical protein